MTKDKKYLSQLISNLSDRDITYLEITALQKIINFKWDTYTKSFYLKQLSLLVVFILGLLGDLIIFEDMALRQVCKGASTLIIGYLFLHEVK